MCTCTLIMSCNENTVEPNFDNAGKIICNFYIRNIFCFFLQTLQVAIATLFYVMTRSKFDSNELDRKCIGKAHPLPVNNRLILLLELLMTLLSIKESYQLVTDDERRGEEKPPLEGKELREFNKITEKSKYMMTTYTHVHLYTRSISLILEVIKLLVNIHLNFYMHKES